MAPVPDQPVMTAQHPESEYAVWKIPGTSFTVSYWLSLFHEIDFQVNEGFRRIPHGGIEIAGLLFGTSDDKSVRIEASRPIDCEHSRGPSFVMSERDVEKLREQIGAAPSDGELSGLNLIGCFIAHTRSELKLNERDLALFDQFFPEPGKLLVLAKPERFQPTRFAFLVRGPDGKLEGDKEENAVILPGSARPERPAGGPMPAIPAPAAPAPVPASRPSPLPRTETEIQPAPAAPPYFPPQPAATPPPPRTPVEPPLEPPAAIPGATLPSVDEIRRRRAEVMRDADPFDTRSTHREIAQTIHRQGRRSNARLAMVLFVAAALGCVVGYFIYLQLPPAVIPLNAQKRSPALIVSWPPEQTRDAVYAALRVDDGDPIPLSSQQKADGQAAIRSTSGNVKIELIAQHWMRDSRGILRYVEPLPSTAATSH
jgi:hypothetical protein